MGDVKHSAAGSNESAYKMLCVMCAPLNTGILLGST